MLQERECSLLVGIPCFPPKPRIRRHQLRSQGSGLDGASSFLAPHVTGVVDVTSVFGGVD